MSSDIVRPRILDKDTDDEVTRQIKDRLRQHLDDFVDLMETQPKLVEAWKVSPTTDEHGRWRSEEDCAEAERIRVAAYDHFQGRHPSATSMELSNAYAAYMSLVRGRWTENAP
jgi:hypothetical protein